MQAQPKNRPSVHPTAALLSFCTSSHLGQQLHKIWRDETQNKLLDSYSILSFLMPKLPAKNYGF